MEIVKVYKESLPAVRLIGRRYTDADRDGSGTFAGYWQQWFREGLFDALKQCEGVPGCPGDYLGAMRMLEDGKSFEYWIGLFLSPNATAPEGFESVDIPAGEIGVCWLYGNDKSGELYSMEASDSSMAAFAEKGWKFSENAWFLERYNHPRFTTPDEKGNVILDVCAYLIGE